MTMPAQKLIKTKFVTIFLSSNWHGPSRTKINHKILLIELLVSVNSDEKYWLGPEKL